ncbi:type VI secretion system protein TssA [Loktanella sp. D2R18]|uniref:type VI secretion system protein TssA n=1 Tax=Rhodobacterales TaxID=204455 RepID=UPI000DE94D6A|nr:MULTISPECIES: type VI secretion system protein TssA [Rhodobacterales]MDO6590538.1 type VI secretion system protein TssA [Yoonia sp. 1_MG-2023]RBW41255.1 type VI secretion system protein TssA [Loktanella sp. D2R18]
MLELETLLQSFDGDQPCGEDLEYDPDFVALEMANQPGEERVIGDAVIAAEPPDYDNVAELATDLLGRSKDLRVAVMLADAALRTRGLTGFEDVLRYISDCLTDHWDHVHPQLDDEDDDDPTMRVNAIVGLTNRATILRSLRVAPLVESRAFGQFGLRDIEVAAGEATPPADMENVPTQQTVSAAFQDADADQLSETMDAAGAIVDHISAISDVFDAQIGSLGPDLDPLKKVAFDIKRRLQTFIGGTPEEPTDSPQTPDSTAPTAHVGGQAVGAINTPNDVVNALERVVDYYARNEPSSPLPILLNRAKRLVSADFVTIMKDMAPQGVENVALIGGLEPEEEQYE